MRGKDERRLGLFIVILLAVNQDSHRIYAALAEARQGKTSVVEAQRTQALIQGLLDEGVAASQIVDVDADGIPLVCGTHVEPADRSLMPSARSWRTVPSVIRNDGLETFRLEVQANGPVKSVTIDLSFPFVAQSSPPVALRDDGNGGDQLAGDFVFTSEPFRYDTSHVLPDFYLSDPDSPKGLFAAYLGPVNVEELDGTVTQFLIGPTIGVLRKEIPAARMSQLSAAVVVSPHLINLRTSSPAAQQFLRFGSVNQLILATKSIYQVLPDSLDFFIFFSTDKIEQLPQLSTANFYSGRHLPVQVSITGTGQSLFNNSGAFGSAGRLLGISGLDAFDRGILSQNATHELIHQWVSYTSTTLGLSDGTVHYNNRSNVGSLVGGFKWIDNNDGSFTIDCNQGRNGATSAPPLDKYMMGLVHGSDVPTLHVYSDSSLPPLFKCAAAEPVLTSEIVTTTTIADIQTLHGIRSPGPAGAQHRFTIGFVAESHDRFLTPTEMTFYETFARHYTAPLQPAQADPYVGFNWVSIRRFFGEGTTWSSSIPRPGQ